jgi:hypothetical protein
MDNSSTPSSSASGAQFGNMHMEPPPIPKYDPGASFGKQMAPIHVAPMSKSNYGLSRYTAWNVGSGESLGSQNMGSFRNLDGPSQQQPVEIK